MPEIKTLAVNILDRDYKVACPAGQESQLKMAAETLNDKMQEIRESGKVFGIERIAVMAALNLTHELIQTRPGSDIEQSSLSRIEAKLSAVLPDQDTFNFDPPTE